MSVGCSIHLLGTVTVVSHGEPVELASRQLRMLVAYVAENAGRTISRDELTSAVWDEAVPAAPAAALRALLCRLRAAAPISDPGCGAVRLDPAVDVDVHALRRAVGAAELALDAGAPAAALRLAGGALDSLDEPCCAGLQARWLDELRSGLDDLRDAALEVACGAGLALGGSHAAGALRAARALCRRRPLSDTAHALLMELQASSGDAAEALWTYETFRRRLDAELAALPSPRVRALHGRLLGASQGALTAA